MSINLVELQQKVDRLLFNIAEQNRRAYEVFFSPTPAEVELPQLDENGNLTTVKIPNRALIKKQMWDDTLAAIDKFNQYIYVDAENGDDNNPGSATYPLRTIKKAVDSVPVGGRGWVYYKNNPVINDFIYFGGKSIVLQPLEDSKLYFKATTNPQGDAKVLFGFRVGRGVGELSFNNNGSYYPNIEIIDETGLSTTAYGYRGILQVQADWGVYACGVLKIQSRNINLGDFALLDAPTTFARLDILDQLSIQITNNQANLVYWLGGALFCNPSNISVSDKDGNSVDFLSKIPVIKDSNGIPRNLISNVSF